MGQENNNIALINPASHYAEAYKKLQVNIQMASINKPVKVIQITSSEASEGKTFTAINLASVYAAKGKKTLIIDLDLRKPRIHQIFKLHNDNGIVNILADNANFEEVVHHHESGIDVLVRGIKPLNFEITLESEKLANFIESIKEQYDIIILDCPPAIAVTDASLITKLADGLVFVVAYNKTKKDIVKEALKRLKTTGINILGVVMSQIEKTLGQSPYYSLGYYYYDETNENQGGNE